VEIREGDAPHSAGYGRAAEVSALMRRAKELRSAYGNCGAAAYIPRAHLQEIVMQNSIASLATIALGAMLAIGPAPAHPVSALPYIQPAAVAPGMPPPPTYTPPAVQRPTPFYYTPPATQPIPYYGTRYRSYDSGTKTYQGRNGIRRTPGG
jgi:hypothetical protein